MADSADSDSESGESQSKCISSSISKHLPNRTSSESTDNRDSIKSRMDRHSSNESKVDSRVNCPSSDEHKTENTKAAHRPSATKTLKKLSDTKSDAGTFKIMLPSMQKTQPLKRPLSSSHDVKKAFTADDDDSDVEVMPPSAKMRMRNIGKNTPTACGPNSFAKGKLGFCNYQKVREIELERELLMSPK